MEKSEVAADQLVRAALVLEPLADPAGAVAAMAAEPPGRRSYLSLEEVAARYGAEPRAVAKVEAFAARHGLKVAEVYRQGRLAVLEGTVESFSAAFAVPFEGVQVGHSRYRRTAQPAAVPAELAGFVVDVFGFDNRPVVRQHDRISASAKARPPEKSEEASPPTTEPAQVEARYSFPPATGKGQTVAILLLGGGFYEKDLEAYFGDAMPRIQVVGVAGAENDPADWEVLKEAVTGNPPPPGSELFDQVMWTLEATVDVDLVGSFAPGAEIVVYFAPNTYEGKLEGLAAILGDRDHQPAVISASWSMDEKDPTLTGSFVAAFDQLLQLAALRGISVCFSSGDKARVSFPASSPHALACGGTTLFVAQPKKPECAWYQSESLTTGGGFSQFFARPGWQHGVPDAPDGEARRGLPDVAGKADFTTGYRIILAGVTGPFGGGTSAAAPMWASLLARFNESLGSPVGWLTPRFYQPRLARRLHDVACGSNGVFKAVRGWDATTGWGTPDGTAVLEVLAQD